MSREIGNRAEERACAYLCAQGFVILARNFTMRGAEVDIIAREGETIAFVEVKYRKSSDYASAVESVTPAKRRRIVQGAMRWLQQNGLGDAPIRFDVIAVSPTAMTLYRAAFDSMV